MEEVRLNTLLLCMTLPVTNLPCNDVTAGVSELVPEFIIKKVARGA